MEQNRNKRLSGRDGSGGKSAVDMLEESFNVLRFNWKLLLPIYFVGTLPFMASLLFFINDMSFSALAIDKCAESAGMLTVLFFWKNLMQSIFCRKIIRILTMDDSSGRLNLRTAIKIFFCQGIIQPAGLFIRCISLLFLFTVPWTSAFFNSYTVLAGTEGGDIRKTLSKSLKYLWIDPWRNNSLHFFFFCLSAMTAMNAVFVILTIPWLMKSFLGIESVFSLSSGSFLYLELIFNTSFLSVVAALVFLVIDPLIKTSYAIRIFYAESESKGYDIISALAKIAGGKVSALFYMALIIVPVLLSSGLSADDNVVSEGCIPSHEISDAAAKVLKEREFAWRMPPVERQDERSGIFIMIDKYLKEMGDLINELLEFIEDFLRQPVEKKPGWKGFVGDNQVLLVLAVAIGMLLLFMLFRYYRKVKSVKVTSVGVGVSIQKIPVENLVAEDYEESEWIRIAFDFAAAGDFKSAIRALFMACLSTLSSKKIIALGRSKTNNEYYREIRMKTKRVPEALSLFRENMIVFEKICYGGKNADPEIVDKFRKNYETLKRIAT